MKNIYEKVSEVDTRIKMLLIVGAAFIMISFGFNRVEAMSKISNYIPAINISIKDGASEQVGYLVKQASVNDILSSLEISLGEEDYLNIDGNAILEDNQTIEINRVTYGEVVEQESFAYEIVRNGDVVEGASVEVVQSGSNGVYENTFLVKYINNQEASRALTNKNIVTEAINQVENYTAPEYFYGRLTMYGGDCNGCTGRTAAGVTVNENGANNSGTAQVYYNGGWYYVLAADRSIPFGTIIEISNHNLNLPSVIYGVVLDRGGSITGNSIDIFCGSETGARFFTGSTSYGTQYRIVN